VLTLNDGDTTKWLAALVDEKLPGQLAGVNVAAHAKERIAIVSLWACFNPSFETISSLITGARLWDRQLVCEPKGEPPPSPLRDVRRGRGRGRGCTTTQGRGRGHGHGHGRGFGRGNDARQVLGRGAGGPKPTSPATTTTVAAAAVVTTDTAVDEETDEQFVTDPTAGFGEQRQHTSGHGVVELESEATPDTEPERPDRHEPLLLPLEATATPLEAPSPSSAVAAAAAKPQVSSPSPRPVTAARRKLCVAETASPPETKAANKAPLNVLFVSDIPFETNDEQLRAIFAEFHPTEVHIVRKNGKSKGYGFVTVATAEDAAAAIAKLHRTSLCGREIRIKPADKIQPAAANKMAVPISATPDSAKAQEAPSPSRSAPTKRGAPSPTSACSQAKSKFKVVVQNLPPQMRDSRDLLSVFSDYHPLSAKITMEGNRSLCWGSVTFPNAQELQRALREMNGRMLPGTTVAICVTARTHRRNKCVMFDILFPYDASALTSARIAGGQRRSGQMSIASTSRKCRQV